METVTQQEVLKSGCFSSIWSSDIFISNADKIIGMAGVEVEQDIEGDRILDKGW